MRCLKSKGQMEMLLPSRSWAVPCKLGACLFKNTFVAVLYLMGKLWCPFIYKFIGFYSTLELLQ